MALKSVYVRILRESQHAASFSRLKAF